MRKRRPTFYRIWKKGDVEDFSPIPYLATVMNCMLWVFYGFPIVHPHSLLVLTINGIGLVVELIYLCMYFTYSSKRQKVSLSPPLLTVFINSCDPSGFILFLMIHPTAILLLGDFPVAIPDMTRCFVSQVKPSFILLVEIVLMAIVVVVTLLVFHTYEKRTLFVGILCIIFGTCMYASPLSAMVSIFICFIFV